MPIDSRTKALLKKHLEKEQPLMDISEIKKDFLEWLSQVKFPPYPNATSWENCLRVFPPAKDEQELDSGRRVRLVLPLQTKENLYAISIIENLEPSNRGVYTLTVHVNWKQDEWHKQKIVEIGYKGEFIDAPKARHTIWAQTVRPGFLWEGLNACAIAILGNELVGSTPIRSKGESIHRPPLSNTVFPRSDDA